MFNIKHVPVNTVIRCKKNPSNKIDRRMDHTQGKLGPVRRHQMNQTRKYYRMLKNRYKSLS